MFTDEGLALVASAYGSDFEEKEDLMEYFLELDSEVSSFKWQLAKLWMFGDSGELTDEEYLMVAGLV